MTIPKEVLNQYENATVLITGGAGCIGSNLIKALILAKAKQIIVLDNLSSSYIWNLPKHDSIIFVKGDILSEEDLRYLFNFKPEYVFHLAAHFANQNSIEHPEADLMTNGLGTMRLLALSRLVDVDRFVFASSGCSVYGSDAPIPFEEGYVSLTLDTPYQIHKLLGELYTNWYHHIYGLPIANCRYFNVYGPGEVPGKYRNVIPNFFWKALHQEPLTIMGTGEETRDFCYVGDIVDGTLRMGYRKEAIGESVNLASGIETSIVTLASMINKITNNPTPTIKLPKRSWDKSNRRLASIEKAKKLLNYEPQTKIEDGLKSVHEWFCTNKAFIERTWIERESLGL